MWFHLVLKMYYHWHVLAINWYLHWSNSCKIKWISIFFGEKHTGELRPLHKVLVSEGNLSFWKILYPNKIASYILLGWLNVLHSRVIVFIWVLHLCAMNLFLLIVKIPLFLGPSSILCLEFTRSICRKIFLLISRQSMERVTTSRWQFELWDHREMTLEENSGGLQVVAGLIVTWTRSGFVDLFYSCIALRKHGYLSSYGKLCGYNRRSHKKPKLRPQ